MRALQAVEFWLPVAISIQPRNGRRRLPRIFSTTLDSLLAKIVRQVFSFHRESKRGLREKLNGSDMIDKISVPSRECDVVMKGGITSGVVYPKALLQLKDRYRFRNIGGASAGAIAAAVAAAGEFGRDRGGSTALR
ncbi:patatin-like phospholipase family protein [Rhizobium beringeri]|nr:patatin-like phospholipase family protein [Rhizobium beringeri]WSH13863.1 patatin-like phospholipase family protein [Rhizobium beringeri]